MAKKKTKKKTVRKKADKKKATKQVLGVKPKRKSIPIKDNVYVVEELGDGHRVTKIESEDSTADVEVYTIDPNGECDCKASEFGSTCKHVRMSNGSLTHGSHSRDAALDLLDTYLEEVLRPEFPRARIVNLVEYKTDETVGNAAALACGVLSDRSTEKLTLWTNYKGLLIRVHCFRDLERYRAALSSVRRRARGTPEQVDERSDAYVDETTESGNPPVDVGVVGQTYGSTQEGENS